MATTATAPRLSSRRLARVYFFPWVQPLFTSILAVFAYHIGTPRLPTFIWWIITFICFVLQDLAAPQSRLTAIYYGLVTRMGLRPKRRPDLKDKTEVFSIYPDPPLYVHRHTLRWRLSLIVLICTWTFAVYESQVNADNGSGAQAMLVVFLLAFAALPYGMLTVDPLGYATRSKRYVIWTVLGIIGMAIGPFCFWPLTSDRLLTAASTFVVFALYSSVFIWQRLWAGEHVLNEVIRNISLQFLSWPKASDKLDSAPSLIGEKLRHDRVFILQTTPNQEQLQITSVYGDREHVRNETVPIDESLTGKALQKQEPVVWNDVTACPCYYSIKPDDTKAEIAVPIEHHGIAYGVLDVQARRNGVYGPGDVTALETIARILGAAMAADRQDDFFDEAIHLWEKVATATSTSFSSEKAVFDLFAAFASDMLDADLVIYFPLSLSGCPISPPYTKGEFFQPGLLEPPLNDSGSSLVQLISRWKPYYEPEVTPDSLVAQSASPEAPTFVYREEIRSTCFVPVGTEQERLGALVLNFRKAKTFDKMFQFTILSLAQSLAKVTAQIRYRDILFKGFGRPELNLHSIINRHGLKDGVLPRAETLWQQGERVPCDTLEACTLYDLLSNIEDFLQDVYLTESSIPPSFWHEELEKQLRTHISALPHRDGGQRPRSRMTIDPAVERENPWVKLALYRLITEAINNAVFHGKATNIYVQVQRAPVTIEVTVRNDGLPLPENARANRSSNGIFTLLDQFEEKLGAGVDIKKGPEGEGAIVRISLPSLPIEGMKE